MGNGLKEWIRLVSCKADRRRRWRQHNMAPLELREWWAIAQKRGRPCSKLIGGVDQSWVELGSEGVKMRRSSEPDAAEKKEE